MPKIRKLCLHLLKLCRENCDLFPRTRRINHSRNTVWGARASSASMARRHWFLCTNYTGQPTLRHYACVRWNHVNLTYAYNETVKCTVLCTSATDSCSCIHRRWRHPDIFGRRMARCPRNTAGTLRRPDRSIFRGSRSCTACTLSCRCRTLSHRRYTDSEPCDVAWWRLDINSKTWNYEDWRTVCGRVARSCYALI